MNGRLRILVLLSCLVAAAGCFRSGGSPMGVQLREVTQFEAELRNFQNLAILKALAVAGDLDGVYVSGFAWAYPIQEFADDEAMENCEERRIDRRIEDPCRLYVVGGENPDESEDY